MMHRKLDRKFDGGDRIGERSFSLLETIIAVSLVAMLMVEVSGVQGNSIAFNEYGRKVLQATYLAKRIMSQLEYNATIRSPIKDMAKNEKDVVIEDAPDFTYTVKMEALPHATDFMLKVMSGGLLGDSKESSDSDKKEDGAGAMLAQIKPLIEQSIGEEPIWFARVEVSWPEGAKRASTELAMIIADTKKLEDSIGKLMDGASVTDPAATNNQQNPPNPNNGGKPQPTQTPNSNPSGGI